MCFAWIFGVDKGLAEAARGAEIRVPTVFRFIIKYISPLYLIVVFVGFCWKALPPYVRSVIGDPQGGIPVDRNVLYAWLVIVGAIAMLLMITAIGARRWRTAEPGLDGYGTTDETPEQPT